MRFIYPTNLLYRWQRLFPFDSVPIFVSIIWDSGSFVSSTLLIPRLLTRPIQTHARGEGWPQTIIADAGRSGEARKLAHRAKRKWNIVDERSGGKCYRQGWLGRPIRGPGSKGGRVPREKAEEEDEDKIYRLELGARVLVPAPFLSSLRGP